MSSNASLTFQITNYIAVVMITFIIHQLTVLHAFFTLTKEHTVSTRIGRIPVQTLLGAWLGFGSQPCYEVPSDFGSNKYQNAVINIWLVRLTPRQWPKVCCGAAKQQSKKNNPVVYCFQFSSIVHSNGESIKDYVIHFKICCTQLRICMYKLFAQFIHHLTSKIKSFEIFKANLFKLTSLKR